METDEHVLVRVRRRLKAAAMARSSWTLEQLCETCDSAVRSLRPMNKPGPLDFNELKYAVRMVLKVPESTVLDYELKILFAYMQEGGGVDLVRFLEYLARGSPVHLARGSQQCPDEDSRGRKAKKLQRVHKNLQTGLQQLRLKDSGQMALSQSLNNSNMAGEGKLSPSAFSHFVRSGLSLSRWDVPNDDMMNYYKFLDREGSGLDVEGLASFIRGNSKNMPHDPSFLEEVNRPKVERKKTYKQVLLDLRPSSSMPNFGQGGPLRDELFCPNGVGAAAARAAFALRPSSSFVSLSRNSPVIVRQNSFFEAVSPARAQ